MDLKIFKPKDIKYYNNQKSKRFIPHLPERPSKILELGCAGGQLGNDLRRLGFASELVGIEIYPAAAEQAKKYFDLVYTEDIEKIDLDYQEYFDVIICGDVLEHLRDPWTITGKFFQWLKNDGLFISTIPNIRNWTILLDLAVFGNWKYSEKGGILDDTHLRFFTRKSYLELLNKNKFKAIHFEFLVHGRKYKLINHLLFKLFEGILGSQMLVVARKIL